MDIFLARRDGSDLRRLTEAKGYDAEGSFSPDGKKIVFCSLRDAYPIGKLSPEDRKRFETDPAYFGEIYIMSGDGSEQRRLTHTPGYDGGPFFSPDGERIIWRRFDESGVTADIYTMRPDGSDVRRLTDFKAMSWAPYFHPSGKYVILTANKLGFSNFELFIVDAAGEREPVRVTFTDGFDGLPVFSPDGKQLCWTSGRTADGKSQLFLANWNHEAALTVVSQSPPRTGGSASTPTAHGTLPSPHVSRIISHASAEITAADLRQDVSFLASDELEGRMTGSKGARAAADHLAGTLGSAGLNPAGGNGTFFQDFEFNAGSRVVTNDNVFVLHTPGKAVRFEVEQEFRPLSFTANAAAEGEVVFVGYGLSVPGKGNEGYDSYAGVNISNKIALALRYVPEEVESKRRQELNRYAGLR